MAAAQMEDLSSVAAIEAPAATTASTQSLIQSVLAKHGAPAPSFAAAPVLATPVAAPKKAVAKPAAAPAATANAELKASQDKVKEMAQKLGVSFTSDLLKLGSNSAISDALIEKAVAAGKSEEQINAAMASL